MTIADELAAALTPDGKLTNVRIKGGNFNPQTIVRDVFWIRVAALNPDGSKQYVTASFWATHKYTGLRTSFRALAFAPEGSKLQDLTFELFGGEIIPRDFERQE